MAILIFQSAQFKCKLILKLVDEIQKQLPRPVKYRFNPMGKKVTKYWLNRCAFACHLIFPQLLHSIIGTLLTKYWLASVRVTQVLKTINPKLRPQVASLLPQAHGSALLLIGHINEWGQISDSPAVRSITTDIWRGRGRREFPLGELLNTFL